MPVIVTNSSVAAAGDTDATALWDEDAFLSDHLVMQPTLVSPAWVATDQFGTHTLVLPDTLRASDALGVATMDATYADNAPIKFTSLFDASITGAVYGRGGTPDNDPGGDAWVDQTVGQTGVNHGADAGLQVIDTAGVADQRAFVKVDLTRFSGFTANASRPLVFRFSASHGLANNNALTCNFWSSAADPFTESTITWNNQPAPAFLFSNVVTVAPGAAAFYEVVWSQANTNTVLGNWMGVRIIGSTPAVQFSVSSREAAAANRWSIEMNLRRT